MTIPQIQKLIESYATKSRSNVVVFVRVRIHDGETTLQHWSIETPKNSEGIGARRHFEHDAKPQPK